LLWFVGRTRTSLYLCGGNPSEKNILLNTRTYLYRSSSTSSNEVLSSEQKALVHNSCLFQ